jgi:Calcineurin-like phosphoesterase superfamily domain
MGRLALISDIHGNGVALDAVLADLARRDVADIVCLGDLAAGGPQPREVLARLRELGCQAVRGNADGWLLEGLPPGSSARVRRKGARLPPAGELAAAEGLITRTLAARSKTLAPRCHRRRHPPFGYRTCEFEISQGLLDTG